MKPVAKLRSIILLLTNYCFRCEKCMYIISNKEEANKQYQLCFKKYHPRCACRTYICWK